MKLNELLAKIEEENRAENWEKLIPLLEQLRDSDLSEARDKFHGYGKFHDAIYHISPFATGGFWLKSGG